MAAHFGRFVIFLVLHQHGQKFVMLAEKHALEYLIVYAMDDMRGEAEDILLALIADILGDGLHHYAGLVLFGTAHIVVFDLN